jgi:hypothetical protein
LHPTGCEIVLGANSPECKVAPDAIVYNAEPLAWREPDQLIAGLNPDRIVWDYTASNVELLRGLCKPVHCPVGYIETMETIKPQDEDIDVLFYGWVTPRRHKILRALDDSGLNLYCLSDCYGEERDQYIARSKVVLNLHAYETSTFETIRCSRLFANRRCVVTEGCGADPELEDLAWRACAYAGPRNRKTVTEECIRLCNDATARREQAQRGYEEFKKIKLVDSMRKAIELSGL